MDSLETVIGNPELFLRHWAALAIIAAAWALGRRLTTRVPYRDDLEATLLSTALGLGTLATALMILALAGLFRPAWIGAVLVASQIASWHAWRGELPKLLRWLAGDRSAGAAAIAILTALALSPILLLPFYPPVEFDATLFHLPFAEAIHDSQGIGFFAQLRYPVFPALMEILYALALAIGNDIVAALIHFACFLLVAMLLFHWGRTVSSTRAGYWAALLWVATPTALYTGTSAYVDCGLALFVTATLFCLMRHRDSGEAAWLIVAGCFVAFAAATKYHGLAFVVFYLLYLAVWAIRRRGAGVVVGAVAATLLLALPWYAHIGLRTGNPVFPFLPRVFGWSPWAYNLKNAPELRLEGETAVPWTMDEILSTVDSSPARYWVQNSKENLPFLGQHLLDLFRRPQRFGGRPLTPLLLPLLPLALGLAVRSARARPLFAILAIYFAIWSITARDPRYLLPVVPIWVLLGSEGLDKLLRWMTLGRRARLGSAIGVLLTLPPLALASLGPAEIVWRNRQLPQELEERLAFVERRYPAADAIFAFNELEGGEGRLYGLFAENLRYYTSGDQVGDWLGPNRFATALELLRRPAALHQWLEGLDIQYLFYPNPERWRPSRLAEHQLPEASSLLSHFEPVHEGSHATLFRLRETPRTTEPDDPQHAESPIPEDGDQ